jgi:hypothetical protein
VLSNNHKAVVKLLLASKADPDVPDGEVGFFGTVLHHAVRYGHRMVDR